MLEKRIDVDLRDDLLLEFEMSCFANEEWYFEGGRRQSKYMEAHGWNFFSKKDER